MNLYKEWLDLLENQTDETFEAFWKEYSEAEIELYKHILTHVDEPLNGTFEDLAKEFNVRDVIFAGFLDGIKTSLANSASIELEKIDKNSGLNLAVDFEKLFFNMLSADADHLYSLDEWLDVLSEDKRREIYKDYKRSKIVHVEKKPGRNDPCPCGSGKKYKKCCGKI